MTVLASVPLVVLADLRIVTTGIPVRTVVVHGREADDARRETHAVLYVESHAGTTQSPLLRPDAVFDREFRADADAQSHTGLSWEPWRRNCLWSESAFELQAGLTSRKDACTTGTETLPTFFVPPEVPVANLRNVQLSP